MSSVLVGTSVFVSGWGSPEVRFHEGCTRVGPGFDQGSTKFSEGCGVVRALKRALHAVGDVT